jgi:outer membrane protein assembly factor BamB
MQCSHSVPHASSGLRFIPPSTANAVRGTRLVFLLSLLLTAGLLCSGIDNATAMLANEPVVKAQPKVGPPTTNLSVSGDSFDPYVAVDIYFDTTDVALATTNGEGSFGGWGGFPGGPIPVHVPASAVPGKHWITAVERNGQKAAQKAFLVRTDWAQFRFAPKHKGVNPYENVLSPTTVGNIDRHWSYLTGAEVWSSPAVADGKVYFGSQDNNVYALNASTGAFLWKYTTNGAITGSSPAVSNGVVYVGSDDAYLYALNADTGALLWRYIAAASIDTAPAVVNGVVYVVSQGPGYLYALNASTGTLLWQYLVSDPFSSPALANGVVYFGSWDGNLYALNATSGKLMWKFKIGTNFSSSPAVANGVVHIGGGYYDANV